MAAVSFRPVGGCLHINTQVDMLCMAAALSVDCTAVCALRDRGVT
jgi:hypothetical protein